MRNFQSQINIRTTTSILYLRVRRCGEDKKLLRAHYTLQHGALILGSHHHNHCMCSFYTQEDRNWPSSANLLSQRVRKLRTLYVVARQASF